MAAAAPFLFGSAATATAAATTGLIGTAGAFALAPTLVTAGTLLVAKGVLDAGSAGQAAANFNAEAARRNAGIATSQANADAVLQQQDARRAIGRARAAYGASGVTLEGSPLDILESSATAAELDKQNILYKGQLRAIGYTDDATLQTRAGENAAAQGRSQAASAILTGAGKAFGMSGGLGTASTPAQAGYSIGDYNYSTSNLA